MSQKWPDYLDEAFKNNRGSWDPDRWHQNKRRGSTPPAEEKKNNNEAGGDKEAANKVLKSHFSSLRTERFWTCLIHGSNHWRVQITDMQPVSGCLAYTPSNTSVKMAKIP